ncbi:hypothetical protein PHMEG_00028973 [Phytophthora megakarya]|uniref:Uncharacterized protein n=1 Tax=Phytophthora megakarya TaxID=4795 RepID=A0A225V353_9STRA|nr:hypothetical protein PHMEG_00028973 [Phytophthora megakarya]
MKVHIDCTHNLWEDMISRWGGCPATTTTSKFKHVTLTDSCCLRSYRCLHVALVLMLWSATFERPRPIDAALDLRLWCLELEH